MSEPMTEHEFLVGRPSDPNTHAGRLERWLEEARGDAGHLRAEVEHWQDMHRLMTNEARALVKVRDRVMTERDEARAALARVEALADWHETKADKARRFPGAGNEAVMTKAAQVHDDAARRLRAALSAAPSETGGGDR